MGIFSIHDLSRFAGAAAALILLGSAGVEASQEPADQVVGSYSSGRLEKASALPASGHGFVHLFHESRNRFYGSFGLVELIEKSASEMASAYPDGERLQLGDLSAESGGLITRHASHQNGLDVDMIYFRVDRREQEPSYLEGFTEEFVRSGKLSRNFDLKRNWAFFRMLVSTGRINRIFVDPVIKSAMCSYTLESSSSEEELSIVTETLRRLRPLENHGDHAHIRLTCPSTSPRCVPQVEVPPGSGC